MKNKRLCTFIQKELKENEEKVSADFIADAYAQKFNCHVSDKKRKFIQQKIENHYYWKTFLKSEEKKLAEKVAKIEFLKKHAHNCFASPTDCGGLEFNGFIIPNGRGDGMQNIYIFTEYCDPEEIRFVEFFTSFTGDFRGRKGRWGIYYGEGNIYFVPWA